MISRRKVLAGISASALLPACQNQELQKSNIERPYAYGRLEVFDNDFTSLLSKEATISQLADGFKWTEGPTWDSKRGQLYFSDIPNNKIYAWSQKKGLRTFAEIAGRPSSPKDPYSAAGTNGLLYIPENDSLLICNQDARSIDILNMTSLERKALISRYDGMRFNSPNDIARSSKGALYFTDPPYGLKDQEGYSGMEQPHFGVYRLDPEGNISLISNQMSRPNGIALSLDEATLYVSQSDKNDPIIRAFSLDAAGMPLRTFVFTDFSDLMDDRSPGLPDGMTVDKNGTLFATGPGGIVVIKSDGTQLGRIYTGRATANCTFGEDGSTLFMTATDTVLAISTKTQWNI